MNEFSAFRKKKMWLHTLECRNSKETSSLCKYYIVKNGGEGRQVAGGGWRVVDRILVVTPPPTTTTLHPATSFYKHRSGAGLGHTKAVTRGGTTNPRCSSQRPRSQPLTGWVSVLSLGRKWTKYLITCGKHFTQQ